MISGLKSLFYPRRLSIDCFDFDDDELASTRPRLRRLLGAIIYQAMHDGMLKVRIGVDCKHGTPWMKYFGPADYDDQMWWDMVPPSTECYPPILQTCLSLAELEAQVPIKGVIPAVRGWERLKLEFNIEEIHSFEIAWSTRYAVVRKGPSNRTRAKRPADAR